MLSSLSTENLARASAAHPVRVILAWAIAFVAGAALFVAFFEDAVTTEFKFIGNPESERADTLLEERLRGPEAIADVVIVRSDTVTVDDPIFRETVENLVGRIRALGPEIVGGVDPFYETGDQSQVSESRRSTFIPVVLTGDLNDAETNVEEVHKVLDEATSPAGFEVFMTGEATIGHEFTTTSEEDLLKGETFGGAIAIVILTIVFGAIAAMVLPIALAIMSIVIALGVVALVGQAFELNFFVQNIITMIGLAVGIDYSLFIVSRYREERTRGVEVREAIVIAGGTASRAVLFSGFMVVLALIGLLIVPHTVFFSLGLGAILVVIAAVMAGLTLLPALLIVMGDNVNRLSIRIPGLRKKCEGADCCDEGHEEGHYGYWDRFSRAVMKVPVLSLVVTVAILVAASVAYFDINIGTSGVSSFPEDFRGRQGFEVLQSEFGFGLDAPAEIVIEGDIRSAPIQEAIARLTTTLDADERFGSATLETNQANDLTVLTVPLVGDPTSGPTIEAVETLRDEYIPAAFSGVQADILVGGRTSEDIDFIDIAISYQPIVFAFVLGLSFILLMVVFRSIVIPFTAIIMNLLSVGAAYGLLVLVFQKGYGNEIFGFDQVDVIQPWMPLMLFAILFGLSMDYQVFLLSRIQERYNATGDNSESVVYGVTSTAGLITGAALIMVAVFGGFAAGTLVPLQQFGFGMAVAVLIDATLIRTVLVPATMKLLGRGNWYLPGFLNWLPEFRFEAGPVPEQSPAPGGDD